MQINIEIPMKISYNNNLRKKKAYVYALGFHFGGVFKAYYVGRTTNLKSRLTSHEHRETGSIAVFVGFRSEKDAHLAEGAIIKKYKPRKNINHGLYNPDLYKDLIGDDWTIFKTKKWTVFKKYINEPKKLLQEYLNGRFE